MRIFYFLSLLFLTSIATSQEVVDTNIPEDKEYREDQFYFNITYNLLRNTPSGTKLRGLTGGFGFGYIRDMPINERRNISIGLGAGFAYNRYGQNVFIGEDQNEASIFSVLNDNTSFDINRFTAATLEVPLEFRWRTSTTKKYKFWRIYTGVRVGYSFWYRSYFKQDNNEVSQVNISEFKPLSFTPTFSFGFNKINFFASYTVTPLFDEAQTSSGEEVGFNPLRLGIIFYIL